jgi:3-dehydroquinate dehydratase/shikimate dehydrogenase
MGEGAFFMREGPLLCVTVTATNMRELRVRRDAVVDADIVELRLDSVSDPDVPAALQGRRRPVLITCRPAWEGGAFAGSERERHGLLAAALEQGAEYVDVEWRAGFDDLTGARGGRGVVVSMHEFGPAPRDLADRVRAMRTTGAEIVKVAIGAETLADTLPLFELARAARSDERAVLLAMGAAGLPTRVLAARLRSHWTYAGGETHVGQIRPSRLLNEFRFRSLTERTSVYGVVGRPIGHSVSPAMHNAGFSALGIDAVYVPLEATDVEDFFEFATALGVRGASVTAPFKRAALGRIDEADPVARRVGALNTLKVEAGRWLGRNTDVAGFLAPLRGRIALRGARAVVLGSGGGARAVVAGLVDEGARVAIAARSRSRAEEIGGVMGAAVTDWPPPPKSWDVLVNATPLGTFPGVDESPMAGRPLDGRLVYDLVYNPSKTRLQWDAERAGCETIGGLAMLVEQAREQFEWWTGSRPDSRLFAAAAEAGVRDVNAEWSLEKAR